MIIRSEQLLQQTAKKLLPIYFISGDEPLLVQEACDIVRCQVKKAGYADRELLHVEAGFNWEQLIMLSCSMSLLSNQQLIELRMPTAKPGDKGSKILQQYVENLPEDKILLIVSNKIDASAKKTKWFKAIDSVGAITQIWPVERQQLPQWIRQRMQSRKLIADIEALQFLADQVEGNLLAAYQEVEKLYLLYGEGKLTLKQIAASVVTSARFDVFQLIDAILVGDGMRSLKILATLKQEGVESIIVLWALTRELRTLARIAAQQERGYALGQLFKENRIWDKRQPIVERGLRRLNKQQCWKLLEKAVVVDQTIKGLQKGNVWDSLSKLTQEMAGAK